MKVLLINPPRYLNKIPVIREDRCEITERYAIIPPYSLLWIGGILKNEGFEVELIDANRFKIDYTRLKEILKERDFDVVLFRFTPTTFEWDMKVASIVKELRRNSLTIGLCLTLKDFPKEVLERAKDLDIYIPQEWESVVPELLKAMKTGKDLSEVRGLAFKSDGSIIITEKVPPIKNYDSLPLPAYDLLPSLKGYRANFPVPRGKNFMIIYTSKGCPFQCSYCTVARTPFKIKSPKRVIEELKLLYEKYDVRVVSFFDETFTINRDRVIKICEYIKEELPELRWYCNTRVELVDLELLQIMYEGGCRGIAFGVESGSQRILDNVKKGNTVMDAENAIIWAKSVGIKVFTSFIFGLPGENWDSIKETIEFVKRTLPHGAQFNVAVPYPGTEFYKYIAKNKLFAKEYSWEELMQHKAIIKTENLSPEDLLMARKKAYRTLYFNPKWVLQNFLWIIRHPEDFYVGFRYYLKALKNYLFYKMEHAH
ncbi:MAG: radical SAM protein [Candidatus Aenigmatarchaeota archaeon]